jgi:tRNA(Ile)-lysidine synthase
MAGALAAIAAGLPDTPLVVAFSGGLDSTVLLHAFAAEAAARARGLRALHVQHDLQPGAADWAAHCQSLCREWQIECEVRTVQVARNSGLGLEAAAREARYAAFAASLAPGETLALAQHRDDQAETVLLRLLRASGSDGLAAMHARRQLGQSRLWRPLLDTPRSVLLEYARTHGLRWLEDPSNADTRHDRNFLRHRALPLLAERWPGASAALARSARLLSEDAVLLGEEAARRLQAVRTADAHTLDARALLELSPAWRARVLRHWFEALGLPSPAGRAFTRIDSELLLSRHDAQPEMRWAGVCLQRWRGLLHVELRTPAMAPHFACDWNGGARLQLPDGGSLELLPAAQLPESLAPLRVVARQGGERIRLPGRAHSHALKDCLQRAGLPPWLRRRLPLLRAPDDNEVLAAGDAIVSARWQAECAPRGLRLRWLPH